MSRIDDGAQRLDQLAEKLVRFPNLIGSELDLSQYMNDEIHHRVKSADSYREAVLDLIAGNGGEKGTALPWNGVANKFELRTHEMTVWTGYKGHGKSLLISQVLNAVLCRGESLFIISPEFRPERVLLRMMIQRLRTDKPDMQRFEKWLNWLTPNVWLYDAQASLKPRDVVALCRYAAKELGVKHILIDSLMKCGIPPDDYGAQKSLVDQLQNIAHQNPLHMHLVAHARKDKDDDKPARLHDIKGASEIADMAENVMSVWRNKKKEKDASRFQDEPDAILTVEAQRNADGWIGAIPLYFDRSSMLFYETGYAPDRISSIEY